MNRYDQFRFATLLPGVVVLFAVVLVNIAVAAAADQSSPDTTSIPTHRPLRLNAVPDTPVSPTEPEVFKGYERAPAFQVVSRQDKLTFYPCTQCHQYMKPNPEPRRLVAAPHPAALDHGKGRMWCLDCHSKDDRAYLRTINDSKVSFNESYLVCGQCHATRQQDWYFGAHGKRVRNWQGERTIYSCVHCHDPHSPSIKPRKPSAPPPVRAGLQMMPYADRSIDGLWQQFAEEPQKDEQ